VEGVTLEVTRCCVPRLLDSMNKPEDQFAFHRLRSAGDKVQPREVQRHHQALMQAISSSVRNAARNATAKRACYDSTRIRTRDPWQNTAASLVAMVRYSATLVPGLDLASSNIK
jgi:hypothetical protein